MASGLWAVLLAPLEVVHAHEVVDLDQLQEALSMSQFTLDVLQTELLPAPTR